MMLSSFDFPSRTFAAIALSAFRFCRSFISLCDHSVNASVAGHQTGSRSVLLRRNMPARFQLSQPGDNSAPTNLFKPAAKC